VIGFEDSVNVAEETREPSRVFPPALFLGLGIALAVYNVAVLVLRRHPVQHGHWRAPSVLPVLGALACAGLIVQKAFEDAVVFAYAGGLLGLGVVLWALSRTLTGPAQPVDPTRLAD